MKQIIYILVSALITAFPAHAGTDADSTASYAWGENVGWINFYGDGGTNSGVEINTSVMSGYAWGENIGWVFFGDGSPDTTSQYQHTSNDHGVNVNPGGTTATLTGYAWGENIGWINFDQSVGQPILWFNGTFIGYAWGENVGWINLSPLMLADGDQDALADAFENNSGTYVSPFNPGTDPNDEDSDNDGLLDGEEIAYNANPHLTDTDSDNINDGDEVNTYNTDPNDSDSDDDTLSDYAEIFTYNTNPNNADPDGDNMDDSDEVNYGLNPFKAEIFVQFDAASGGTGHFDNPYNALVTAVWAATSGQTIALDSNGGDTSEVLTINKEVTIKAIDGAVRVGSF